MKSNLLSVYDVVHYLKQSIDHDTQLQSILIKGEISNFINHRSGHWYFTLKDKRAKINCVMFSSYASRCKILLKEGMQVIVQASVSIYEASGSLQIYVTKIQIDGLGDLYLQLEEIKKRMNQEGLFSIERKKPLPDYPMSIGVISAKTGAAIQDILTTIARRWPIAEVCVYPSLVQGVAASNDIVKNLKKADEANHDVILLARGGGAIEDLWCFNEESVARCICDMKTVIVTGVGHETDTTLVDYVSDARAATPTAAAELITPNYMDVIQSIQEKQIRMTTCIHHLIERKKQEVESIKNHRYLKDPLSYIRESQMQLDMCVHSLSKVETKVLNAKHELNSKSHNLAQFAQIYVKNNKQNIIEHSYQIQYAMQKKVKEYRTTFEKQVALLDAFSPLKVLQRGYAIAQKENNIIRSVDEVSKNEDVKIRLNDGYIYTTVKQKEKL